MTTESCARTHASATDTLVIERGEGVYVFDSAGKRYLEGPARVRCRSLGYDDRELILGIRQWFIKAPTQFAVSDLVSH